VPERAVIIDTGPIVAYLQENDSHHEWLVDALGSLTVPVLTCEAVVTEAMYLLRRTDGGQRRFMDLLLTEALVIDFELRDELEPVQRLLSKYKNIPISLADACLVRMSERITDSAVLTLDSDFTIYRRNGRQQIPLILPPD